MRSEPRRHAGHSSLLLLPAVIAALAACSRYEPPVTAVTSLTAGSASAAPLDDGAIATIAISIALGQAERGRAAESQARDPRLRAFAVRIVEAAPASEIQTTELAPRGSTLQDEVTSSTNSDLWSLSKKRGMTFDRAFVDAEVQSLAAAIKIFDDALIPTAVNAQLKEELVQMRAALVSQLREAKYLSVVVPPAPGSGNLP